MQFVLDGLSDDDGNKRHVTVSTTPTRRRVVLSTGIVGGNAYEATMNAKQALALSRALKTLAESWTLPPSPPPRRRIS